MVRYGGFHVIFPLGICTGIVWIDRADLMLSFPRVFIQV